MAIRSRQPRWQVLRLVSMTALAMVVVGALVLGNWSIPGSRQDLVVGTGWVNADALNVRAEPSTTATILDVLPVGSRVSLLGEPQGGFLPVAWAGEQAWVAETFVSQLGSPPGDAETPGLGVSRVQAAERDDAGPVGESPVDDGGDSVRDVPAGGVEAAEVATGEHWIDVNRTTATVTLYIGEVAKASYSARIGWDTSPDGFYSTAVGTYHVFTMHDGLSSTPFVDDVYMTEFVGFDPQRHNGFHSPIRNADGSIREWQNPTTLGCVRLDEAGAAAVYAFAFIGMRVEVHD